MKTPHDYSHGLRCISCNVVIEYVEDIWHRTVGILEEGTRMTELVCQDCFFQAPGGCPTERL